MTPRQNLLYAMRVISLAIIGNVVWIGEIIYRFGWASLEWLYPISHSYTRYAPFLLVSFPGIAFLFPIFLRKRVGFLKLVSCMAAFYFINLLFYYLGENLLRMYFSKMGIGIIFVRASEHILLTLIALLPPVFLLLFFGAVYFMATRILLFRISPLYIFLFAFIMTIVLPLSFVTYVLLPANNDDEWFFNAIKAGYPVFWTTVLMGFCGWFIEKNTKERIFQILRN